MTTWQDWLLAFSILAINISLMTSLWGVKKPRVLTCVLMSLALLPQIAVFFSLSLWYSLAMVILNIALWTILGIQSSHIRQK